MGLCDDIKLNGLYAIPHLYLHPHYYADKYVECDWIVYQRFWYTECLAAHPPKDVAMMYYNIVSDIINSKSVNIWEVFSDKPKRKWTTYLQVVTEKEKDVFEVHLYTIEEGHYNNFCFLTCSQWNKDKAKHFTIGNGTIINKIY